MTSAPIRDPIGDHLLTPENAALTVAGVSARARRSFPRRSELSLSRNTVGTHIKSIYAKLGVSDRSAAVRRARGLQLLSAGRTR